MHIVYEAGVSQCKEDSSRLRRMGFTLHKELRKLFTCFKTSGMILSLHSHGIQGHVDRPLNRRLLHTMSNT